MIDQGPIHLDSLGVVEIQKLATYELSAIVCNNAIRNSKPMDNVLNELDRPFRLEVDDGLDLDPLSELVNGD